MKEITGNIFDITDADAICVTTNGVVKTNGELVMGKGIALEFAKRWPLMPKLLGLRVAEQGNHCYIMQFLNPPSPWIFTIPTKHDWREKSDIQLIIRSLQEMVEKVNNFADPEWMRKRAEVYNSRPRRFQTLSPDPIIIKKVVLTRPGCGNGGLDWETEVKPAIKDILDDRFYIITP